jgi:hypothetical protein
VAYEDFTTYTESPSDADITQGSKALTATTYTGGAIVYKRLGNEFFTGARVRCKLELSALPDDTKIAVCVVSDSLAETLTHINEGFGVYWSRSGSTYSLVLENFSEGTTDTSSALSPLTPTTYYCELRRYGKFLEFYIYLDSSFSTLVDTLTLSDEGENNIYRHLSFFQVDYDGSVGDLLSEGWGAAGNLADPWFEYLAGRWNGHSF